METFLCRDIDGSGFTNRDVVYDATTFFRQYHHLFHFSDCN